MRESNFQMEAGSHPWFLQLHTYSRKAFMEPLVTLWYLCGFLWPSSLGHLHHCLLFCVPGTFFCIAYHCLLAPLSQPTWFPRKAEVGLILQPSFFLPSFLPFFPISLFVLSMILNSLGTQILDIFRGNWQRFQFFWKCYQIGHYNKHTHTHTLHTSITLHCHRSI